MLTRQQHNLLTFIAGYIDEHGYGPTFDDMRTELGLASKSNISRLMDGLEERGFIRRKAQHPRSVEVLRLPEMAASTENMDRFKTLSLHLSSHVALAHADDGAGVQIGKMVEWLAVALTTEPDNAGVAARLRRLSSALANAAGELSR